MAPKDEKPSQKWKGVMEMVRIGTTLVGVPFFQVEFRPNWRIIISIVCIVTYLICTAINIVETFEENPSFVMEALCMVGTNIQACIKIAQVALKSRGMTAIKVVIDEVYEQYEDRGSVYYKALERNSRRGLMLMRALALLYVAFGIFVMLAIYVTYAFFNKHYTFITFTLPYVDVNTSSGYLITLGVQLVIVLTCEIGIFASDLYCFIAFMQVILLLDIFKVKIEHFNDCTTKERYEERIDDMLTDIIRWHQKYIDFVRKCGVFDVVTTTVVLSSAVSILFTLYVILTSDWPIAYAYILVPIVEMYLYCFFGTQVEICNEKISQEIYNIAWYNLSVKNQKLVLLMLLKSQAMEPLMVAGVHRLSVSTALQITKTIYTTFMLLLEFL